MTADAILQAIEDVKIAAVVGCGEPDCVFHRCVAKISPQRCRCGPAIAKELRDVVEKIEREGVDA